MNVRKTRPGLPYLHPLTSLHHRPSLILFATLLLPGPVLAWGATGHRVVGAIAEQHLTKKARKAVHALLGDESMAIAATWMDEVKSDHAYDGTYDWHWVTIPDGGTYATAQKNPHGDVIEAIGRMEALLKSDTTPASRRKEALLMLIHLVGDLHQPLHVGRGDDKGGNTIQVRWFHKGSNLHRVWDSGMIDQKNLSYTELACSIDHASAAQIKAWQQGTPADWAQEEVAYRPQIYGSLKPGDKIGYDYEYRNWPLVQQQLLKGGIRLAGILNALFR